MSDHKALVLDAARAYHRAADSAEAFTPGVTEIWPSGAVLEEDDRLALVEAALDMRGLAFFGQGSDRSFHAAVRNLTYSAWTSRGGR